MTNPHPRRAFRFPIADVAYDSPDLPGQVIEISRSGLRLATAISTAVGQEVPLSLTYRDEIVEINGVVRWVEPARSAEDDRAPLASWEVGIAFAWIGEVDPEGIWRGLRVYRDAEPGG